MKFISFLKGKKIKNRFTGVELADFLLKKAKNTNLKVLVVVSKNSLSAPLEIERGITDKFGLAAKAKYFPDPIFFDCEEAKEAQIILVNFGAPEQENFINEYRHKFPEARILAGVGGAFDFLTGRFKRAPKIFRNLGLEWLWRLFQEPKRIKRIYSAVIVFPFLSLTRK
jgi:N-acetylglucosaminyldiphosphoundecaprenol N-acetyl-beta-D-mannosaminyltransferase